MINLLSAASTANLSTILSEDAGIPALRNPNVSGMRKVRPNLFVRLFKNMKAKK